MPYKARKISLTQFYRTRIKSDCNSVLHELIALGKKSAIKKFMALSMAQLNSEKLPFSLHFFENATKMCIVVALHLKCHKEYVLQI